VFVEFLLKMSEKCTNCGKAVYMMERKALAGRVYHATCVKCKMCGVKLGDKVDDHNGDIYCPQCYNKNFVDQETLEMVDELERGYSKRKHGAGVAMPGIVGSAKPIPTALLSKDGGSNTGSNRGNEIVSPRKAMPTGLQSAIVGSAASLNKPKVPPVVSPRANIPPPIANRGNVPSANIISPRGVAPLPPPGIKSPRK